MNVQDLLGAMLQGAAGGQGRQRLESALGGGGQGDVLGQILGGMLGGGGTAGGAAGGGGLGDLLGAVLGGGGAGGAGGGGLGDLLGQILGGGGAAGGMAGGAGAGATGGGRAQGGLSDIMASALGDRAGAPATPRRAPLPDADGPGAGGGYAGGPVAGGPAAGGGGLGDVLGQILGGAGGGAGAGGLLSILASLAIGAMQGGGAAASPAGGGTAQPAGMPGAAADPETVSLLSLKAMIAATKADGQVDDQEIQAVMARMGPAAQDPDARAFLEAEFRKPLDLREIVGQVRDPQTAAQVYLSSLLAIRVDTRNEAAYLQELQQALRLPPEVVDRVHRMVGLRPA